jgi:hypothetical protein
MPWHLSCHYLMIEMMLTDHIHMITHLKSRAKVPCLFVPAHAAQLVDNYVAFAQELTDNQARPAGYQWDAAYTLRPCTAGQRWRVRVGGPAGSELLPSSTPTTITLPSPLPSSSPSSSSDATPPTSTSETAAVATNVPSPSSTPSPTASLGSGPRAAHSKEFKQNDGKPLQYTHVVEVIQCDHTVPTVGYGFSERRTKLKEQYSALSGAEIGKLRKTGVEVADIRPARHYYYDALVLDG